jgi:hypothetical protein
MHYSNLKLTSTNFFFKPRAVTMKVWTDTRKLANNKVKDKDICEIFAKILRAR